MCGEHVVSEHLHGHVQGSSPHVRGARLTLSTQPPATGIIPACAGSTPLLARIRPIQQGSSPHVRGAQKHCRHRRGVPGIIPACAGSTIRFYPECGGNGDHPRMCGEHSLYQPRRHSGGIIPACAGSTSSALLRFGRSRDHPRMCGEHGALVCTACWQTGSSPHVRGAHFENSIIPRKRKDNWLFFIQFRFENFLALLHPFLGVPTKDPSFASLGRLINCNPSQSTGDQSAPYTLKAICCSFLAE